MNIGNITSNGMNLNTSGKDMKIELYEKEINRLNSIINELEKYIVEVIDDAQKELNIILQGNNLDYKNECTKEFNCIKNALDMLLDKLKELKEGNNGSI